MKPVAIDLFCGKGGWTNALLEAGFEVHGFDWDDQPEYKGIFHKDDLLVITVKQIYDLVGRVDFAVCSSPCEEFSIHCMKHFHPNPKWPSTGLALFQQAKFILDLIGCPYVMENVRCAEKFVGKAVNHCGPFYLWGNAVPAVFPPHAYKVTKGIDMGSSLVAKGMSKEEIKAYRRKFDSMWSSSKSPQRKAATAQAAMIPLPIARAVAEVAKNLALETA